MIVEIPEPGDYETACLSMLKRAWDGSDVIHPNDTDEQRIQMDDGREIVLGGKDDTYTDEERAKADAEFWAKSQPALGNALAMVQQAVELALKARVARVSPFLLIARDPRDYPKGSSTADIPFSAFRTIDAADLLRVHDTVCEKRLGPDFGVFWESLRRDRNRFIHSGSVGSVVTPTRIMECILTVNEKLFPENTWLARRIEYLENDELQAAYSLESEARYFRVLEEFDFAIRHMEPKQARHFFGYDARSTLYRCIHCYDDMHHDYQDTDELADLAQLIPKGPKSTTLRCVLCKRETKVMRQKCIGCSCTVLCAEEDSEHYGECMSGHHPGIMETDEDDAEA